jgi:hypothetical protein
VANCDKVEHHCTAALRSNKKLNDGGRGVKNYSVLSFMDDPVDNSHFLFTLWVQLNSKYLITGSSIF